VIHGYAGTGQVIEREGESKNLPWRRGDAEEIGESKTYRGFTRMIADQKAIGRRLYRAKA